MNPADLPAPLRRFVYLPTSVLDYLSSFLLDFVKPTRVLRFHVGHSLSSDGCVMVVSLPALTAEGWVLV